MALNEAYATSALAELNGRLSSRSTCCDALERESADIAQIYNRTKTKSRLDSSTDNRAEFVLIRGLPGTGKEELLKEILSSLAQQDDGSCIAGRFDQLLQNQRPFDVFAEAFSSYVDMVVRKGGDHADKLGLELSKIDGLDLLLKMIPSVSQLIPLEGDKGDDAFASQDKQNDVEYQTIASRDASNRSNNALRLLLRAILASSDDPLVLVLEHLHWADEAALDVLQSLLRDSMHHKILFLATERDDRTTQQLKTTLKKIHATEVTLTRVQLSNMNEEWTIKFVAQVLEMESDEAARLGAIVFRRAHGNRYFTVALLQDLVTHGVLKYDGSSPTGKWSCNVNDAQLDESLSMEETLQKKLRNLPNDVMRMLRYASCLGSRLNTEILGYLMEEDAYRIALHLQVAKEHGFLTSSSQGWEFVHETVQDAASGLVPQNERELFHLRIGRRLWKHFSIEKLDENIFIVVRQLLAGERLATDPRERVAMAKLCLRAAEQSVFMSSFHTAYLYFRHGIDLLGTKCWEENYSLTLELFNNAVEVSFCISKFEELYSLVDSVVLHAQCFDDTLRCHATKIFALGSSGSAKHSLTHALEILEKLDVRFPKRPCLIRTVVQCQRIRRQLRQKSTQALLRIPPLKDERKLAAMQILGQIIFEALLLEDARAPLIVFRMITISLDYGICATSSIGFVLFAALLCGPVNDIDEGFRIGQAGFGMYDKFGVRVWLPRLSLAYYSGVHTFKEQLSTSLEPLLLAQRIGIESGDLESALMCGVLHHFFQLETRPISETEAGYLVLRDLAIFYGQGTVVRVSNPTLQFVQNLMGRGNRAPAILCGDAMSESDVARLRSSDGLLFVYSRCYMTMLAFMFGELELIPDSLKVVRSAIASAIGSIDLAVLTFLDGLASIALFKHRKRRSDLRAARRQQRFLRIRARGTPHLFLPRQLLLDAEIAAATDNGKSIHSMYLMATAQARGAGSLFLLALANELAGKYFLSKGDNVMAWSFLRPAISHYEAWGAKAKADHLAAELKHVPHQ